MSNNEGVEVGEWYWSLVDKQGPKECWPWRGVIDHDGYGRVWYDNKRWRTNRLAYLIDKGSEPRGLACHTCDNRWCVNPAHIYDGTAWQNVQDRKRSGVSVARHGVNHANARFSREDVLAIRASTESPAVLAERYGVRRQLIWKLRVGETYSTVTEHEKVPESVAVELAAVHAKLDDILALLRP